MTELRPPPPKPPAPSVRSPKGRAQPLACPGGASPRANPKIKFPISQRKPRSRPATLPNRATSNDGTSCQPTILQTCSRPQVSNGSRIVTLI